MKAKKLVIAAAAALVMAGLVTVSYTLAGSGALEGINEKYNIFEMVDDSLDNMRDMNVVMGEVRNNVGTLNGKLDLLSRTNELLEQQLVVVDELNGLMAGQKPLLEETNASISVLDGKLQTTLGLARGLEPLMGSLIAAMDESLSLTGQVVDGSAGMVGTASYISALFDQTLGYLGRIQPHSSKAKAYMAGDILSRLSSFLPSPQNGAAVADPGAPAVGPGESAATATPAPSAGEGVTDVVEHLVDDVVAPLLDTVNDTLDELLGL
jgi:hypothetical protein